MCHIHPDIYSSMVTAPLCKIWEQSNNFSWRYCISKHWGIQKVLSRMQLMWLSSHCQFVLCIFWCFTLVSNFKAIGQWVMEILHIENFKDLGDTASVVTNAVILVFGVSNFNTNVPLGDIYPHIKLYYDVLGIYNVMPLQSHTQTHTDKHIVRGTENNRLADYTKNSERVSECYYSFIYHFNRLLDEYAPFKKTNMP